jgi:hypothetical protein
MSSSVPTARTKPKQTAAPRLRYEAVKIDKLFEVLEAVAVLPSPTHQQIAQFANIDPRLVGKLLKNARLIRLVESADNKTFVLAAPYPFRGTMPQKRDVVREALLRLPLITSIRQFLGLGNELQTAMRKAATVAGVDHYEAGSIAPLIMWANEFKVLDLGMRVETLVDAAVGAKLVRHAEHALQRVAFISHSSKDKPFVRQLAADLVASGVKVWLDEQRIRVGDSIPEKIAHGVAESDFFLLVVSKESVESAWVKKELSGALVHEIERRRVTVMPIKIDEAKMPATVTEKKYADFSESYERGLQALLDAIKAQEVTNE